MSESTKTEIKTVKGPKACVARFVRPRDGVMIFVYPKRGETRDVAIQRVLNKNGASGVTYDYCA
jgi:hypothetical protein